MPENLSPQRRIIQISAEIAVPSDEVYDRQQRIIEALRGAGVPKIELTVSPDSGEHEMDARLLMSVDEGLDKADFPAAPQHKAARRALRDQGVRTLRELLAFGQGTVSGLDNVGPRTMEYLAKTLETQLPHMTWLDQPTPADIAKLYGRIEDVPSLVLGKYLAVPGWPVSRIATADVRELMDAKWHNSTILNRSRHATRQKETAQRFMAAFFAAKDAGN